MKPIVATSGAFFFLRDTRTASTVMTIVIAHIANVMKAAKILIGRVRETAGFALSVLKPRGSRLIMGLVIATLFVPPIVLLVPST